MTAEAHLKAAAAVVGGGGRQLDLSEPRVMGILNVTPDSFCDGGQHNSLKRACNRAEAMLQQGADLIDVGGESSRPGATPVPLEEELRRVVPVVRELVRQFDALVSVDTVKAGVMSAVIDEGAWMINDVCALAGDGTLQAVAGSDVAVCLMHMLGKPRTMQDNPRYDDVVAEVAAFFEQRCRICEDAGIGRPRLVVDPGFGFGKTLEHNCELLRQLPTFLGSGTPVMIGLSRKAMVTALSGSQPRQGVSGSVALGLICYLRGARIFRVHDVIETVQALRAVSQLGWLPPLEPFPRPTIERMRSV